MVCNTWRSPLACSLLFTGLIAAPAYSQVSIHASENIPIPTLPLPKDLDMNQVYIKDISVNGTGCSNGTFARNLSEDKRAFTLTFSDFVAAIGPGVAPGLSRRNCNVTLNLNVPAGFQYTVGTFNYRGFMALDQGVKGEVATKYYFAGNPAQGTYVKSQLGEFNDEYVFTDIVGFSTVYVPETWSPCNIQRPFSINSTITLTKTDGNPNSSGAISNDSIDGELIQQFGIAYRRCGETTPPNPTKPGDGGTNPNPNPNPFPNPSPNNGLENGKTYNIVSRYSGQCLDVRDHALYLGAPLQQWSCTGEPHQKFKALYQRDGSWLLVGIQSGKYVSVENSWMDNGNGVVQYDFTESDNQKIIIDRSTDGSHRLKFRHSNKCLDIDGPNFAQGTRTHQWDCQAGNASQDWFFLADRPVVQANLEYELVNRRTGKCFDVFDHGVTNGVRLQQWTCTNEPHQKFRLVAYGAGSYSLVGVQSGKTVTVRDWAQWNGADLIIWDDQWAANQRLILTPSIDGSFQVRFAHSNKCLDVDAGSFADGARVQQWDCQISNPNQEWFLRRR